MQVISILTDLEDKAMDIQFVCAQIMLSIFVHFPGKQPKIAADQAFCDRHSAKV